MNDWLTSRRFVGLLISAGLLYVAFLAWIIEPRVGTAIATRGLYVVIGLIISAAVVLDIGTSHDTRNRTPWLTSGQLEKLCGIVALSYLSVVTILKIRWVLIPAVMPLLVYAAVRFAVEKRYYRVLRVAVAAFALPPTTKIVTNSYYFPAADAIKEIPEAVAFKRVGDIAALPGWYADFPLTFELTTIVSFVTTIDLYHTYHLVGILLLSVLPLIVYAIVNVYTGPELAAAGALVPVLLYPFSFYATYFEPQTHNFVLFSLLVLVLVSFDGKDRRWAVLGSFFVLTIVLIHHLSVLFIISVLAVLYAGQVGVKWSGYDTFNGRYLLQLLIVLTGGYWIYTPGGSQFIKILVRRISYILLQLSSDYSRVKLGSDSMSVSGVETFVAPPARTVRDSIIWLLTPDGVTNIIYLVLVVVALYYAVRVRSLTLRARVMAVPGVVGLAFVLKTPFVFPGFRRIQLFWTLMAAFVLVYGVRYLLNRIEQNGAVSLAMVLLLVLSVTAPLSVAEDVGTLRPDTTSYERTFSNQEKAELDAAARFAGDISLDLTTMHTTAVYLQHWHDGLYVNKYVEETASRCRDAYILYRISWTEYATRAHTANGESGRYVTSERRLVSMTANSDKVYTTGETGIVSPRC